MNKAVIFGSFEFLGFHFCTRLLEQGYEVVAINDERLENEPFFEEKRMTIGRNANFTEINMINELCKANITDQSVMIINYYDYFMESRLSFFEKSAFLETFILSNSQRIKDTNSKMIKILPIQWLRSRELEKIQFNHHDIPCHNIYIPTIYGPWQPAIFMFQQAILKDLQKKESLSLNEREWIHDAIYVEDVVESALEIIDSPPASFLLESETKDHWLKCAQFLSIPLTKIEEVNRERVIEKREINVKLIKSPISIREGIERQKKHCVFLLEGYL